MRSAIIFLLLLAMSGVFVVLQVTRKPVDHRSPAAGSARAVEGSSAVTPGKATKGTAKPQARPRSKPAAKKAALPPRMSRPLRVSALGWELLAPGVVANGGAAPSRTSRFSGERLQVHLAAATTLEELEAALARGGADPSGADIAILPLPELAAASEQLRALAPMIFLVLGWSSGRDAFLTTRPDALARPPRAGPVELAAARGGSAAFLGLFLLGMAGVDAARVKLIDPAAVFVEGTRETPGKAGRRPPAFAALQRPLPSTFKVGDELRPLLTTADLRRLIPIVAVAPAGLFKGNLDALAAWGQVWMAGIEQLQRDVPAAARQVASLKLGPPALELLNRLGQIEAATLGENARVFGLSGRDPVTLEELFRRCFSAWRSTGLLSSPLPERAPVQTEVIAAMVRTYPTMVEAAPAPPRVAPPRPDETASRVAEQQRLLVHAPLQRRLDPREALSLIGFVAGVFERMEIKVSVRGTVGQARALTQAAAERFELPTPRRLHPTAHPKGAPLLLEITTAK